MGAKKLSFMSWLVVFLVMVFGGSAPAQPNSVLVGQAREAAISLLETRIGDLISDLMAFRATRHLDALTAAYNRECAEISDLRLEITDVAGQVAQAGWIAGCGPRMTLMLLQAEFLMHETGVKEMEQTLTEYQRREKILNDLMGLLHTLQNEQRHLPLMR